MNNKLATKDDFLLVKTELKQEIALIRKYMEGIRKDIKYILTGIGLIIVSTVIPLIAKLLGY